MRVQTPRAMLRTLRRMTFHEVGYAPWLAAYGDVSKQLRRVERLLKLSFVLDWKTMGGEHRGREAAEGLRQRWMKLPELLVLFDCDGLHALSNSAPPQLRFFIKCVSRAIGEAVRGNTLNEYDSWISAVTCPLVNLIAS